MHAFSVPRAQYNRSSTPFICYMPQFSFFVKFPCFFELLPSVNDILAAQISPLSSCDVTDYKWRRNRAYCCWVRGVVFHRNRHGTAWELPVCKYVPNMDDWAWFLAIFRKPFAGDVSCSCFYDPSPDPILKGHKRVCREKQAVAPMRCLPATFSVCRAFFPLSLCLARLS